MNTMPSMTGIPNTFTV